MLEEENSGIPLYSHAIKTVEDVLEFDRCWIGIPEGDRIIYKVISENYTDQQDSLDMENSLAGRAFLKNESYLIREVDEKDIPTLEDHRSALVVPIGKFGVFQAISTEHHDFDEQDLKMTKLLMDHVKEALKRLEIKGRKRRFRPRYVSCKRDNQEI